MKHNSRTEKRESPARRRIETRRPDTEEGIEAARSKWEARLLTDGLSRSDARSLATAAEVRRRVKESRVRSLLALRHEEEEAEAAWRRNFRPHAVIVTEQERPSLLMGLMFFGDQRFVFFEKETNPADFRDHVLGVLPEEVVLFGKPVGFVVNYTLDWAVTFDLSGKRAASHTEAYRPGRASFKFSDGWFDVRQRPQEELHGAVGGNLLQVEPAASPRQLRDNYREKRRNQCETSGLPTKATS